MNKSEHQTHLFGNELVDKDHPRIILRGKLDSLQAIIIEAQVYFISLGRNDLAPALEELLDYSRKILGAEVLNKQLDEQTLLNLSSDEIREHSHNTQKYFDLSPMILVTHSHGAIVSRLNYLRAIVRECELVAVSVFKNKNTSIIQALNRLSSCFHILMYQELSKQQK